MTWKVTNTITPYGHQTKECKTIEDAFAFISENEDIVSMATIIKQRERPKGCGRKPAGASP
jgi:hypothetical protein